MRRRRLQLILAAALLALAATPPGAQQRERATFEPRKGGYEAKTLGTVELEVSTRDGPRAVRLSLLKLRIVGGERNAQVQLPSRGLALLQHRAGEAEVGLGREKRFVPLEGEWMRLPLPTRLAVGTEDDSVLMDLIVIEE